MVAIRAEGRPKLQVVTRCALYLRVSSEAQAAGHAGRKKHDFQEERYGLPRQESACREYAAARGWSISDEHVYTEVYSGARLWDRPELERLFKAMANREFDVLLVHEVSRLSRDPNHQGYIFSQAERYGIEWDSVTEDVDNSAMGKALRSLIGTFAEIDRERLILRTQGGHRERAKSGKHPNAPEPRFGYAWADDKKTALVVHLTNGPIMASVIARVAGGVHPHQVCAEWNADGRVGPRGGRWNPQYLRSLIQDPIYKGVKYAYRYETYRNEHGKKAHRLRPADEWLEIPNAAPAIVDPETWEAANATIARGRKSSRRNTKDLFSATLRRRVFCAKCGLRLYARSPATGEKRRPRYTHTIDGRDRYGCSLITACVEDLDAEVWSVVESVLLSPAQIEEQIDKHRREDPTKGKLEVVEAAMEKAVRQYKRSHDRWLLWEGDEDDPTYQQAELTLKRLSDQIKAMRDERDELLRSRASWEASVEAVRSLQERVRRVGQRLKSITPELKALACTALDVKVVLHPSSRSPRWEMWMRPNPEALERIVVRPNGDGGWSTDATTAAGSC